jgi:hypothetical protein
MLFLIIGLMFATTLFVGLYSYNESTQISIVTEEERTQEKIVIDELQMDAEGTQITAIRVNNIGSIAVRIRAIYVDNELIYEPSVDIDAKEQAVIQLLDPTPYVSTSTIAASTERGVKSTIEEGDFVENDQPVQDTDYYFGPLKLDFEEFYYIETTDEDYDPEALNEGWNPPAHTFLVWRINVTNIDQRIITLSKYCCLTLISNAGGTQTPWYLERIEHEDGTNSSTIMSQETVSIYYIWNHPTKMKIQSTHNSGQYRVMLTFFGTFDLEDDKSIPYGQTIPFEAVLIN